MNKIKKFLKNPILYIQIGSRVIFSFIKYPVFFIFFKKIGLLSYVSLRSSIRNHKSISIGNHVQINPFVVLWPTKLKIGSYTQINPGAAIYGDVTIGQHVMIAPNCMIAGGNHNFLLPDKPMIFQGSNSRGIIIKNDVWIGANSTIVDGVIIDNGAIIAAGSVVVKNVASFDIVAGVPAKVINNRLTTKSN